MLKNGRRAYMLRPFWAALCACAFMSACALLAQQGGDGRQFLDHTKLRRGMKGYVLTVVEDAKIEKLSFEILSVRKNRFPKGDLIWAVGTSDKFRHTGSVRGMSGSPAYVDGKLIGAYGYGYSNAKDPLIGIRPIKQMLPVWERNMVPTPPSRKTGGSSGASAILPDYEEFTKAAEDMDSPYERRHEIPDEILRTAPQYEYLRGESMRRLDMPVSVSGFNAAMAPFIEEMFAKRGMVVLQGAGSGTAPSDANPPVVAGSVIGTEYLRGDYAMFGYGTLTYREGDKILAYGHPRDGEGDTYVPLSSGTVHYIIASRVKSSKAASGAQVVGTMTQDREPAIAGVIGHAPPYIPMSVTVHKQNGGTENFNYEVITDPLATGSIAQTAAGVSLDTAEKHIGKYSLAAELTVEFDESSGLKPLRKRNVFSGTAGPGWAAASMMSPITPILNNWYDEVSIKRIHLEAEYRDKRENALIQMARIGKRRVRPGEHVELAVTFRPYLESPVVKRYKIQIPENAPTGYAQLFVGAPDSHDIWERSRAYERYQETNLEQLIENLARGGSQRGIVVSVVSARRGVAVNGGELPNIPLTMLNVMDAPQHRGGARLTDGSIILEERRETPFLASGSASMTIIIDSKAP